MPQPVPTSPTARVARAAAALSILLAAFAVIPQTAAAAPPSPPAPAEPSLFTPVVPARLLDTRPGFTTIDGKGQPGAPLTGGTWIDLEVVGRGGLPDAAIASVVVNVTVAQATTPSHLTVWPTGSLQPTASNLNFVPRQTVANLVVAKVGDGGKVSIFNFAGNVDVIVDVAGYFPETDSFVPLVPARLLDTRPDFPTIDGAGRPAAPIGAEQTFDLKVTDRAGVPASGVGAVILNVTVTNVTAPSHVTTWPTGSPKPTASNLNMLPGETVPNLVVAKVGANGSVSIANHAGTADVIADVAGYFPEDSTFVPLEPARLIDTRPGSPFPPGGWFSGMQVGPGQTIDLKVLDVGGVPDYGVSAVVLNVTGIGGAVPSHVTVSPTGVERPEASNLNLHPSLNPHPTPPVVPNLVVAKVGANGMVSLYNHAGMIHMVVDIAGYFIQEASPIAAASASDQATCVVYLLGDVDCWGQGLLPVPQALGTFTDAVDVAISAYVTCVLRADRTVWCWGYHLPEFWAPDGNVTRALGRVEGIDNVVALDAEAGLTCALRADGTVWCWGRDYFGAGHLVAQQVPGLSDAVQISLGTNSACAVRETGNVACWGRGMSGVLGNGSTSDSATPVNVAGLTNADSVVVRGLSACATRVDGTAACWGNSFLGGGSTGESHTPVAVLDDATGLPVRDVVRLVGGADWVCALRVDDQIYCWGSEYFAALGLAPDTSGFTTTITSPVAGLPPVAAIFGGSSHMCAVAYDSDLYCWGRNESGQVGDGTFENRSTPTLIFDYE